jgi:hypothetical protein
MTSPCERRTLIKRYRLNASEWSAVKGRAAAAGKKVSAFVREAALSAQVIQAAPRRISRADRAIHELARLGNNLNQLARAANASGRFGIEESLRDLLAQIQAIIKGIR